MSDSSGGSKLPRRYPDFWEKGVPIFLGILGVAFLVLMVIIFVVATGLVKFP
jgi:hypothetical protein